MRSRLAVLKRLTDVYGIIESIHSAVFQRADAAVREVQHAISRQQEIAITARAECREALEAGDIMTTKLAEVVCETSCTKRHRLDSMRLEREGLRDDANKQYAASRLKSEQMERLVSKVGEQIQIEDDRQIQRASDDRFLASRLWKDAFAKQRSNIQQ